MLQCIRRQTSWLTAAATLLACLAWAPPSQAALGDSTAVRSTTSWDQSLRQIEGRLMAGASQEALEMAQRLTREMTTEVANGSQLEGYLGAVHALQAVAWAGLGEEHKAIWQWQVASQLFPGLQSYDLARFGAPGQLLLAHSATAQDVRPTNASLGASAAQWTEPRRVQTPRPKFPGGRFSDDTVSLVIASTVDTEGRLTEPRIVSTQGELAMVFAALDAMMDWRFDPATLDGDPQPFRMELSERFDFDTRMLRFRGCPVVG